MRISWLYIVFLGVLSMTASAGEVLPELSKVKSVSGRSATEVDVKAGAAVFQLRDGEVSIGSPINIPIPQYALFNDEGTLVPVIVIQAEQARGQRLIGAIDALGQPIAGLFTDFKLLGNQRPLQHIKP
jgi:hypothetical protein